MVLIHVTLLGDDRVIETYVDEHGESFDVERQLPRDDDKFDECELVKVVAGRVW